MSDEMKRLTKTPELKNGERIYRNFIVDIKNKLNISSSDLDEFLYGAYEDDKERVSYHRIVRKRVLGIAMASHKRETSLLEGLEKLNSRRRTQWLLSYLEYYGNNIRSNGKVNYSEISSKLGVTRQTLSKVSAELEKVVNIAEKIYGADGCDVVLMVIINNKRSI